MGNPDEGYRWLSFLLRSGLWNVEEAWVHIQPSPQEVSDAGGDAFVVTDRNIRALAWEHRHDADAE
jgi:hypothetical protein